MNRCTDGQTLWLAIDAAIKTHDLDAIYHSLQQYFIHKNGLRQGGKPCRECKR